MRRIHCIHVWQRSFSFLVHSIQKGLRKYVHKRCSHLIDVHIRRFHCIHEWQRSLNFNAKDKKGIQKICSHVIEEIRDSH